MRVRAVGAAQHGKSKGVLDHVRGSVVRHNHLVERALTPFPPPPLQTAPKSEDVLRSSVLTEDIPAPDQPSWPCRHADQVEVREKGVDQSAELAPLCLECKCLPVTHHSCDNLQAVTALLQLEDADELPRRQPPHLKVLKVNPRHTAGPPAMIEIKPPADMVPAMENINAPDMKTDIGRIVRVIDGAHKGKKGVFKGVFLLVAIKLDRCVSASSSSHPASLQAPVAMGTPLSASTGKRLKCVSPSLSSSMKAPSPRLHAKASLAPPRRSRCGPSSAPPRRKPVGLSPLSASLSLRTRS